jgi:hypothetical protein
MQAKAAEVAKYAPQTLAVAKQALADTHSFIETQYRDRDGVAESCRLAVIAAKHALHVATEASKLAELGPGQAEQRVLFEEQLIQRFNRHLKVPDLIAMPLEQQVSALENKLQALLAKQADSAEQTAAMQDGAAKSAKQEVTNKEVAKEAAKKSSASSSRPVTSKPVPGAKAKKSTSSQPVEKPSMLDKARQMVTDAISGSGDSEPGQQAPTTNDRFKPR